MNKTSKSSPEGIPIEPTDEQLAAYLCGLASEAERTAVEQWLELHPDQADSLLLMAMGAAVQVEHEQRPRPQPVVWWRWAAAAAVVGVMVMGVAVWHQGTVRPVAEPQAKAEYPVAEVAGGDPSVVAEIPSPKAAVRAEAVPAETEKAVLQALPLQRLERQRGAMAVVKADAERVAMVWPRRRYEVAMVDAVPPIVWRSTTVQLVLTLQGEGWAVEQPMALGDTLFALSPHVGGSPQTVRWALFAEGGSVQAEGCIEVMATSALAPQSIEAANGNASENEK